MERYWPSKSQKSSNAATPRTGACPRWRRRLWPRRATPSRRPVRKETRMDNMLKPRWLVEVIAVWGYVQRNYFLTKRYFMWELVWLTFTTVNAMSITCIGAGVELVGGGEGTDTERLMTFLLVGALIWSYLSMIFDVLSETVQWERWEGTIEYTFMSPTSRVTHLLGMGVYAVVYGIARTAIVLGVAMLAFDNDLSGVYYPVKVLPDWMQIIAQYSPVTYALEGSRAALQDGVGLSQLWGSIWPLLIMGAVFVPMGLSVFHLGESYAKRTGKLKRSG